MGGNVPVNGMIRPCLWEILTPFMGDMSPFMGKHFYNFCTACYCCFLHIAAGVLSPFMGGNVPVYGKAKSCVCEGKSTRLRDADVSVRFN
jgi:hypothetical protein